MGDFAFKSLFSRIRCLCIVFFLVVLISYGAAEYDRGETVRMAVDDRSSGNDFHSCTEGRCIKRTSKQLTGMWFGPRLGKRRKFEDKMELNSDAETISDTLGNPRWTFIVLPGEKAPWHKSRSYEAEDFDEDFLFHGKAKIPEVTEVDEEVQPVILASRLGRRLPWTSSFKHNPQLRATLREA